MVIRNSVIEKHRYDDNTSRCFCCQHILRDVDIEMGHIIAFSKGGDDTVSNLVPLCSSCNKSLGDKNLGIFMDEMGFNEEIEEF